MRELPTRFVAYEISQEELLANKLTTVQEAFIRTLISNEAHIRLNIHFDGHDHLAFAQQEAYHTGRMKLLEEILTALTTTNETTEE